MEMNKQSRGQFLKTLGLSSKALMAFYCIGAVSACSSEDDTVTPDNNTGNTGNSGNTASGITGTTTGASLNYTIDLKTLTFRKTQGDLFCNNHSSEFGTDGSVQAGPASSALKTFKTTFDATASTLKIG